MRRREQEIKDRATVEAVLKKAVYLTLGLCRQGEPYVVPVSFGYADGRLYFHTGAKGLKMDILRANPRVSFTAVVEAASIPGEAPCKWDMDYQSVIGFGQAVILEDEAAKVEGLRVITAHYAGPGDYYFPPAKVKAATVVRIDIETMTGKRGQ
ncbi:MAG: pyridoxamine 5'-phosphate oxidase family protein [Proteobacteria bacterium]|nr:pyridoxamine 5'-phosphate oxidase family protein [Pseudomonadota bacterium]MBU1740192.1 pyridoxamine 5'-phosphate oxidase family protein [Pseudomonadota bacterium]